MIETCNVVFVQARMQSAAFEAARLATRPTTSQAVAATSFASHADANTLLTQLGVSGATVSLSPSSLTVRHAGNRRDRDDQRPVEQEFRYLPGAEQSLTLTAQATMIVE